jgi:aryl-alcohol dehydrogenase-like predicted oxidoreductase
LKRYRNIEQTALFNFPDEGFSTFDLADIYGPAEDYVGAFRKSAKSKDTAKDCQVESSTRCNIVF